MSSDKRVGMGPVPTSPEMYINEKQVEGMSILKKFGWKLVCIRRPGFGHALTVLKNSQERSIGVLGEDGILRLTPELKIRQAS
ncbi:MAG: hypothetical protein N0E59_16270 [Candidatus Thiodiazotropha taylori]|nr:hypothetical protein [Candidatus Thiodiazotropha taylori]MCG7906707.1 hypothetical protein [Candidatus Thiodiazotropha taylori]MCG7925837.1 hypothetical protein [Candidatus Thiodiazotropha taylori]MCG7933193.1 hypothetical protein [Candidatus Thiodiazotropha taylori]MCG7965490.1 hypothetical protein [Candidatus Thiodiazotropha taylori]